MLVTKFKKTAETRMSRGMPDVPLHWGAEILPGDFIAVRYTEKAKKYHHIGALLADENHSGQLDPGDGVLHAGPDALHSSLLAEGAFDGHIMVLRP